MLGEVMRPSVREACESIDAAVFVGDFLNNDDERTVFREYLERWERAVTAAEVAAAEIF